MLVMIFIAFINRFIFLFQPIRYDEAFSFLVFASKPLSVALSNYQISNNHLLNTFFEHIFFKSFGPAPEIIRLPAFIAGILIFFANYSWIKKLYDENTALISSALLASSSILIDFSTNARGYTLMILLSILLFNATLKLISSRLKKGRGEFAIFSSLGFYTLPTFLLPFSVAIVFLFIHMIPEFRRGVALNVTPFLASLMLIALLTLLFYLPIFFDNQRNFILPPFFAYTPSPVLNKKLITLLIDAFQQWVMHTPRSMLIIFNLIFLVSFIDKNLRRKHLYLIISAIVGYLGTFLIIRRIPDTARHLLFLLPIYYALIAASLAWFINLFIRHLDSKARFNAPAILALILSLFLSLKTIEAYSRQPLDFQSAQSIVSKIKYELKDTDRVFSTCPADAPIAYYFYLSGIDYRSISLDSVSAKRIFVVIKHGQGLSDVLNISESQQYSDTRLISGFQDADLYVINK